MTDEHLDLTTVERRAYDALPREAAPRADLEERTIARLRAAGHLPTPISAAPGWPARRLRAVWIAGAAAAGLALFASGLAVGQIMGQRSAVQLLAAGSAASASQAADHMEQAGRLYVTTLARLGEIAEHATPATRDSLRAAAARALGLAAQEMALIAPDDPLAVAVLRGLNERSRDQVPTAPSRSVVWY